VPTVEDVTQKVQRILANTFSTRLGDDGEYFVDKGSTSCRIRCNKWGPPEAGHVLVTLEIPLLFGVPITDELCRWVAIEGRKAIGTYAVYPNPDSEGEGALWFEHALLGDTIDTDELAIAVGLSIGMADNEDDMLQERFGGKRMIDD
jgi:hypothetical protein